MDGELPTKKEMIEQCNKKDLLCGKTGTLGNDPDYKLSEEDIQNCEMMEEICPGIENKTIDEIEKEIVLMYIGSGSGEMQDEFIPDLSEIKKEFPYDKLKESMFIASLIIVSFGIFTTTILAGLLFLILSSVNLGPLVAQGISSNMPNDMPAEVGEFVPEIVGSIFKLLFHDAFTKTATFAFILAGISIVIYISIKVLIKSKGENNGRQGKSETRETKKDK